MRHARPCPDGGFITVGYVDKESRDIVILKTDADGFIPGCCPQENPIGSFDVAPTVQNLGLLETTAQAVSGAITQKKELILEKKDICVGLRCAEATLDVPAHKLGLFPNPAQGTVTVDLPYEPASLGVELFNLQGQILRNKTLFTGESLNIESLPEGWYGVKAISTSGNIYLGKFLKQN